MTRATPRLGPSLLRKAVILVIALLAVLCIFFLCALMILRSDTAKLKVVLETLTSSVLNRELHIGELVEADLGWDTYLLARNVRLNNPDWAPEPDFARVGQLLLRINLPSIWRDGPIVIDQLQISDARLTLLAPAQQSPNWDFWPDRAEPVETVDWTIEGEIDPEFPVLFRRSEINNTEILLRGPQRSVLAVIEQLALDEPGEHQMIELDLTGTINEVPLQAVGHLGPTAAILSRKNLGMDLALTWGGLSVDSRGSIADLGNLSGVDLHLKLSAPRSRPLLDLLGLTQLNDGALDFEAHITDAKPGLGIDAVGSIDELELTLRGKITEPKTLDGIDMNIALGGSSLAELGTAFDLAGLPEYPYEIKGELSRDGTELSVRRGEIMAGDGRLSLTGRLPNFPQIDDWELQLEGGSFDLAVLAPLLGVVELPPIGYDIKAQLSANDEGVELVDVRISSPQSVLQLKGSLGEAPQYVNSRVELDLSTRSLSYAGLWLGVPDLPDQEFSLSGSVALDDQGWQLNDAVFKSLDLQLTGSGRVNELLSGGGIDGQFTIDTGDLSATAKTYGYPLKGLPAFPLSLSGRVSGSVKELKFDSVDVRSQDSRLSLSAVLGNIAALDKLDVALALELETPDVMQFLPPFHEGSVPQVPVAAKSQIRWSGETLNLEVLTGTVAQADVSLSGLINTRAPREHSEVSLTAKGPSLAAVVDPWLDRQIGDAPFDLSLDLEFRTGGLHIEKLQATVANDQLKANFVLADIERWTQAQGNIAIAGSSSLNLAQALGLGFELPDGDFMLNIGVQNSNNTLVLAPLTLQWGKSDYAGTVEITPGEVLKVDVDLYSKYVSLPFLLPDIEALEALEARQAANNEATGGNRPTEKLSTRDLAKRVIPDDPLDFSWLKKIQGNLKYQLDEMHIREDIRTNLSLDINIVDGVLSSQEIRWDGTFAAGNTELRLQALDEGVDMTVDLDFQSIPLFVLARGTPNYQADSLYRARLSATGNSFRELASSADGALVFRGSGGRLSNKGMDLILGDTLEELFDRLNPFSETDPYTTIDCSAGAVTIKNGKVVITPGLVIRTNKMDIAAGGAVDLKTEKLNIDFNTRSRKGIGISAGKAITPYFRIGGTLAYPGLALDVKGAAISGGAAVATAGLSIFAEGLWDRWVATAKNPCERLFTQASRDERKVYGDLLKRP